MADPNVPNQNPTPDPATTGAAASNAASRAPASNAASGTAASNAASGTRRPGPPRPAVQDTGEGYPEVDTLSFDPEDGDWTVQARRWVEENPGLALLGAAAAGLLLGRLVAAAIPEPEPEPLSKQVERRAKELAKQGQYAATDAGEVVAKQLAVAAEALGEASVAVGKGAKRGYDEAKDFGEYLAETVGQAIAKKAGTWIDKMS